MALPRFAGAALATALLLAGCGTTRGPADGSGAPTVVASFYPLAEAAGRVAGDRAEVVDLTPSGAEPHDLELTTDDIDRLRGASLALYLGGGFQPAVEAAVARRSGRSVDLLEADLPLLEEGGDVDPHIWLDPGIMTTVTLRIRDVLTELDPGGRSAYEANATRYAGELAALDEDFATGLARCDRRTILTAHDAFGYLARAYDLGEESVAGLSPESEPDPRRLAELARRVADEGITTVFSETLVSPRVAEALAREAGVQVAVLDPLEGLTDEQRQAGAGYVSVMEGNLATLRAALGCR